MTATIRAWAFALSLLLCACTTGDDAESPAEKAPKSYHFKSFLTDGESSVSNGGQLQRHLLIGEMKAYLSGLTAQIDADPNINAGDVTKALLFYYDFDASTSGEVEFTLGTTPPTLQKSYKELGSKNLKGKIAGNDVKGQHKDWNVEANFQGWKAWGSDDKKTPEGLVLAWAQMIDDMAIKRAKGEAGKDPAGKDLSKVYVTAAGRDLQQLLQKFLLGAVAFSQGADDYLDDDLDGKGLNAQNEKSDKDGAAYTSLEHGWDEGFGYWGASRDYGDYSDDELSGKAPTRKNYFDTNKDGVIDLLTEYNYGHCINAAKRDRGSDPSARTDYTKAIFDAFLEGRFIIASAKGPLSADAKKRLVAQRDIIVTGWEKSIAATIVHYINDVTGDMSKFGTADYNFYDHAKHWSELKGFALSLQFSRWSPMQKDFEKFHDLIGDAPVLAKAGADKTDAYNKALATAREMLGAAYEFDDKNLANW